MLVLIPVRKCQADIETFRQILVIIGRWQIGAREENEPGSQYVLIYDGCYNLL